MGESLGDQIMRQLKHINDLYYRLILVVAPEGGGKTAALQEVGERLGLPIINVNLKLSRRMLDLTERQRTLQTAALLDEIIGEVGGNVALLDNTEILFETTLKQDPLLLLQRLSRNRIVVAAWNGSLDEGRITYAVPGHPEFRRYPGTDCQVISSPS